jgi:hypothetical protein
VGTTVLFRYSPGKPTYKRTHAAHDAGDTNHGSNGGLDSHLFNDAQSDDDDDDGKDEDNDMRDLEPVWWLLVIYASRPSISQSKVTHPSDTCSSDGRSRRHAALPSGHPGCPGCKQVQHSFSTLYRKSKPF